MDDDDPQPTFAPIRGAPPGAPAPPFPTAGPEPTNRPTRRRARSHALTVTAPEEVHKAHSLMSPNEIAIAMEHNRERSRASAKEGLKAWIANAKLLKLLYDEFGYRGEQYRDFAMAHLDIKTKEDANRLYLLGHMGDAVLARCEAEERVKANYEWPNWRAVLKELKAENDRRERRLDDEPQSDPEVKSVPEPDPLADMMRERDDLQAQVKAITQQMRNERAAKEEAQEANKELREELDELRGAPLPAGAAYRCFFCDKTDLEVVMMVVGRRCAVICDSCIADAMMIDDGDRDADGRAAILDIELYRRDEFGQPLSKADEPDEGNGHG